MTILDPDDPIRAAELAAQDWADDHAYRTVLSQRLTEFRALVVHAAAEQNAGRDEPCQQAADRFYDYLWDLDRGLVHHMLAHVLWPWAVQQATDQAQQLEAELAELLARPAWADETPREYPPVGPVCPDPVGHWREWQEWQAHVAQPAHVKPIDGRCITCGRQLPAGVVQIAREE